MYALPYTATQKAAIIATLRTSHRIRVGVRILDRNEKTIEQLDVPAAQMLDGEVTVDARADITRSLAMTFVDPKRRLGFDASSPARGAVFADNFVAIEYGVLVPSIGWVEIPCFWGPVTKFDRDQAVVSIEAQGKEALALDPHFVTQGYTIKKGRRVDHAIHDVMDRLGETRYDLPDLPQRLPRARAVEPEDEAWDVVKFGWEAGSKVWHGKGKKRHRERETVEYNGLISLAGPMYAFYAGNGRLTVRRRNRAPVIELQSARDLAANPVVGFDVLSARNTVIVTGAKVTVGKRHVQHRGQAALQPSHPLSPKALARNGHLRHMTEFVSVDGLKTQKACDDRAATILAEKQDEGLELDFDCLPFPMLEENDYVRVVTGSYSIEMPLKQFTIPLTAGSSGSPNFMHVGDPGKVRNG